jgi:serpin B
MKRLISTLLSLAALFCHCNAVVAQSKVVEQNNAFALDFYARWSKQADKNIVISPFSMSAAVGMIYPGAKSVTAEQIRTAMRYSANLKEHNEQFKKLMSSINAAGGPMVISNTLWMQQGFRIETPFLDQNTQYFDSNLRQVDFAGAADSTRRVINERIEKQTRDKIKDLLPAGSINNLTRMVLTNAIYFKDAWSVPFDGKKTKDRKFNVSSATSVTAPFMEHSNEIFQFFEDDRVTIVDLLYRSGQFSMLVVLPKKDLATVMKSLNVTTLNSWNFKPGKFRTLQLPKFKIDHEVAPAPILKELGMTNAFQEGKADFSGVSKEARLFISGIFHKAFIEVNEQGTEAAAATAVVAQAESVIEPVKELDFIANKPFLFILRDRVTNSIVFIGKVQDPR